MQNIKIIIDIGNGFVKWVVISEENNKHSIVLKDIVKTKWMRKGKILDYNEIAWCIAQVITNFQKKLWSDFVDDIYVSISHPDMYIARISEQKRILSNKIDNNDIQHLYRVVNDASELANYEMIKTIPAFWLIDDNQKVIDPMGMECKKIELFADLFYLPKNFYHSLTELFDKLQINVSDIVPNILGSVELAMDYDSKDLWSIIIDIGNNQTSWAVYENGMAVWYGVLPIWWEDVTKDISIGMQIDIKEAETTKLEHATLIEEETTDKDTQLDHAFLKEIVMARYEEIFDKINNKLEDMDKDGRLPGWVILTWGGSKIYGAVSLAKNIFKLSSSLAKDKHLHVWEIGNNLQFTNILGVYQRIGKNNLTNNTGWGMKIKIWTWRATWVRDFIKDIF